MHGFKHIALLTLLGTAAFSAAAFSIAAGQAQAAPPASVDKTTPKTQQGLTLLAVSRGDAQGQYAFPVPAGMDFLSGPRDNGPAGGIGLWVRGPKPPAPVPQRGANGSLHVPFYQNFQPSASGMALNGDQVLMQVEPVSTPYSSDPRGGQPAPLFLMTLPGGYPSGYPAIDVTMNVGPGHTARWRLINLTAPYHAIAPPVALHSAFAGAGVTLSVHAWRDTGYVPSRLGGSRFEPETVGIHYSMTGKVPTGTHWVVRIDKRQLEWEAVRPGEMQALQAGYGPQYARHSFPRPVLWTAAFGASIGSQQNFPYYPMQDMVPTPYGKYDHFLRVSGTLVQLAAATEAVTFHNLNIHQSKSPFHSGGGRNAYVPPPSYEVGAKPQTVVTPSGLSFTLLPLSALGPQANQFGYGGQNSIRLLLRFGQALPGPFPYGQPSLVLPRSPLYKKYHKPVTYTLQAAKPYFLQPLYGGLPMQGSNAPREMIALLQLPYAPPVRTIKNGQVIYQQPPNSVPKHLNALTLNVVQTAELKTIPISFTVPIGNQPPPAPAAARHFPFRR